MLVAADPPTDDALTVQKGLDDGELTIATTNNALHHVMGFFQENPTLSSLLCGEDTAASTVLPEDFVGINESPAEAAYSRDVSTTDDSGDQVDTTEKASSEDAKKHVRKSMKAIPINIDILGAMLVGTSDNIEVSDTISSNQRIPMGGRLAAILPPLWPKRRLTPLPSPFIHGPTLEVSKPRHKQPPLRFCVWIIFLCIALLGLTVGLIIHAQSLSRDTRGVITLATGDSATTAEPSMSPVSVLTTTTLPPGLPAVVPNTSTPSPVPSPPCMDQLSTTRICYEHRGENIVVHVTICNAQPDDWVGIYLDGVNLQDLGKDYIDWQYACDGEIPCTTTTTTTTNPTGTASHLVLEFRGISMIESYRAFLVRPNDTSSGNSGVYSSNAQSDVFSVARECGIV